jgi:predicted AAA+ superfamily ATPase
MYTPRTIETTLQQALQRDKIIMIMGARQVGKTSLLNSLRDYLVRKDTLCYFLTMEDSELLQLCNNHPRMLLEYARPKANAKTYYCIDEIQYLSNPTNFLKYLYDMHHGQIQLIVTGSSSFYLDTKFADSLVGRKEVYELYSLSRKEFLQFKHHEDLISEISLGMPSLLTQRKL